MMGKHTQSPVVIRACELGEELRRLTEHTPPGNTVVRLLRDMADALAAYASLIPDTQSDTEYGDSLKTVFAYAHATENQLFLALVYGHVGGEQTGALFDCIHSIKRSLVAALTNEKAG